MSPMDQKIASPAVAHSNISCLATGLSIGLSDLVGFVAWFHSPALRFGLCWYPTGLSDLPAPTERLLPAPTERLLPTPPERLLPAPPECLLPAPPERLLPAPTERLLPGLKDRPDTSIARRAMTACQPIFLGLKDRRIVCMAETSTPPSIGLSDLVGFVDWFHSPALRFGLCWYPTGLSDLPTPTERLLPAPTERLLPTPPERLLPAPPERLLPAPPERLLPTPPERLLPGLKDRTDTSIAQRAMTACQPIFLGLKDRRIVCMAETSTPPSIGLSDLVGFVAWFHSPALRFGLCWYPTGLSDLPTPTERLLPTPTERLLPAPPERLLPTPPERLLPGLKDRTDTSIARRAMVGCPHIPRSERPADPCTNVLVPPFILSPF